jgi:hypothetical protein
MKYIFPILVAISSISAFAQTPKSPVVEQKQVVASTLQASMNSKGEMIFKGKDISGKPVMFSAEEGYEFLRNMAKLACAASPSSITASAGVISLTWEKCEICKGVIKACE